MASNVTTASSTLDEAPTPSVVSTRSRVSVASSRRTRSSSASAVARRLVDHLEKRLEVEEKARITADTILSETLKQMDLLEDMVAKQQLKNK